MLQYNKDYIIKAENIHQILEDAKPEWNKRKKLYEMKTRKSKVSILVSSSFSATKLETLDFLVFIS